MTCSWCDGEGVVVESVLDGPIFEATTCPNCLGTGLAPDKSAEHIRQAFGLVTLILALVAGLSLVYLILSHPRSTATVDLSRGASTEEPAVASAAQEGRVLAPSDLSVPAQLGNPELGGVATWYAAKSRFDAAAGPALRDVLGDWRGRVVTVSANGHSVVVRLSDACACGDRNGKATLLDLDRRAFARLAPLAAGVVEVVVSWESGASGTLPPTDVDAAAGPMGPQGEPDDGFPAWLVVVWAVGFFCAIGWFAVFYLRRRS